CRLPAASGIHAAAADVLGGRNRGDRARLALGGGPNRRSLERRRAQRIGQDISRASAGPERWSRRVGPSDRAGQAIAAGDAELPVIRQAIRNERKLRIFYQDGS